MLSPGEAVSTPYDDHGSVLSSSPVKSPFARIAQQRQDASIS